jgi:hypothetical protein
VCHKKVKSQLDFRARCLFGRLARSMAKNVLYIISPTHKQTEGRAPVWGSEFTSKRRRTTGGIQQKPLQAERKNAHFGDCLPDWCNLTAFHHPILFRIYLNLREQFRFTSKESHSET